ncbi:hypothetical protein OMCYN_01752 [cyanobiont of Ornithocercus magnificus]|nr:hypothetical protein OMCYN_01752 [cyanobiont of Ornithocercus magnificus]
MIHWESWAALRQLAIAHETLAKLAWEEFLFSFATQVGLNPALQQEAAAGPWLRISSERTAEPPDRAPGIGSEGRGLGEVSVKFVVLIDGFQISEPWLCSKFNAIEVMWLKRPKRC